MAHPNVYVKDRPSTVYHNSEYDTLDSFEKPANDNTNDYEHLRVLSKLPSNQNDYEKLTVNTFGAANINSATSLQSECVEDSNTFSDIATIPLPYQKAPQKIKWFRQPLMILTITLSVVCTALLIVDIALAALLSNQQCPTPQVSTTPFIDPSGITETDEPVTSLPSDMVAFVAARMSSTSPGVQDPQISLTETSINEGAAFQTVNLEPPNSGFYWFHVSVGIPENAVCNVSMVTDKLTLSIIRTKKVIGLDVTSRDDLIQLRGGQQVRIISTAQPHVDPLLFQTSWIGFRLDNIMRPFVAVSVGSSSTFTSSAIVPFDRVFVDTHNAWNLAQANAYTIPVAGIYFISYHISSQYNGSTSVLLYVNNNPVIEYNRYITSENFANAGCETLSTSLMLVLQQQDTLTLKKLSGAELYSDNTYQTAMSAFLYQPASGNRIAWSVATDDIFYSGSLIKYNTIFVNEGYGFKLMQPNLYKFVSPEAGLYYAYVTSGNHNLNPMQLSIFVNNQTVGGLQRDFVQSANTMMRSRAVLVRLELNDVMFVVGSGGNTSSSIRGGWSLFSGFKLHS